MILIALLLLQASPTPLATEGDDIVVTARRGHCRMRIADRLMADAEFRRMAPEWAAGRPVRIVVPRGSSYVCQARILLKLERYGVHNAVFIDR